MATSTERDGAEPGPDLCGAAGVPDAEVGTNAATVRNELLARVRRSDAAQVHRSLERVQLAVGQVVAEAGSRQQHVYFPSGCLVSVCVQLEAGRSVHIGLIGCEGFVGLPVLLDNDAPAYRAVCQIAGDALRMPTESFQELLGSSVGFRRLLLQYAGVRLGEEVQHLACLATHTVSPRLARWLLVARDRVRSDNLPLTHDILAEMLVVGRPYLSRLMKRLQQQGYIAYRRGRISILDGSGLGAIACTDYIVVRAAYDRFFGARL